MSKKKRKINTILHLVNAICLCIFIFSGYKLISYYFEYKSMDSVYANIIEDVIGDATYELDSEGLLKKMLNIDMDSLFAINDEVIGYILIPDTKISYPLLYSANDPIKYLNYDAQGNESRAGAIFIDTNNKPSLEDDNTIIYGHNMMDNSMFGELSQYIDDKEFFAKHAYIYIYTRDEIRLYRIYAAFSTVAGSDVYTLNFPNANSMQNYITNNAANSAQTPKIVPEKAEHLITLSTCQSSSGDGRNVVLAYLVDTFPQE